MLGAARLRSWRPPAIARKGSAYRVRAAAAECGAGVASDSTQQAIVASCVAKAGGVVGGILII